MPLDQAVALAQVWATTCCAASVSACVGNCGSPATVGSTATSALSAVPASVKNVNDFLAWCKANPTQANYGSPAAGSTPHFIGVLIGRAGGVDLKHVPYRGTVPSITDLVGGQIAAAMNPSGDYLQYMKTGRVRVLATSGKKRSPFLPDVPTFTELGYPDVTSEEWFGFYAPAFAAGVAFNLMNLAVLATLVLRRRHAIATQA